MTALDVILAGYGYAGRTLHAPLLAAVPGLRLTGVVSSRPEAVRADLPDVAVAPDLEAALVACPQARLVVIATPNHTHEPLALQALEAGCHVVVDKPVTLGADAARGLADRAAARGLVASAFHNRRWDGDFLALRKLLADGVVGTPAVLESRVDRFRPQVRPRWREQPGPGAGLWYDLGPHLVDQALLLFGRPQDITADIGAQRDAGAADDWFHVILRYGRLRVILHATTLAAAPGPRFAMHGDAGSWIKHGMDSQEAWLKAGARPGGPGWGGPPEPAALTPGEAASDPVPVAAGDWTAYYAAVRDAVLGRGADPVPMAEAAAVMAVIEAGLDSAASGRTVPAP